jgi:hypothetical protein
VAPPPGKLLAVAIENVVRFSISLAAAGIE